MNQTEAEQMLAELQRGRLRPIAPGVSPLRDFDESLEEVVMWCRRYADLNDPRLSLRPARLAPPPLATSRFAAIERVTAARRNELARIGDVTLDELTGRLLVYFPDASVAAGRSEERSAGFFDVHDAPPWGTWIGYFEGDRTDPRRAAYLLAWVPTIMVGFADDGIVANDDGSIAWLRDTELALRHIIDHTNLCRTLEDRRPTRPR